MKRKEENRSIIAFMIVIRSMQDDDILLRSFVTIKPAAEKILSDRTDVDGTAKYRRARNESLEYLSELSFHHDQRLAYVYITIIG
jgi:hypothetical protein